MLPSRTQLYKIGPARGDHRPGLRAGVSVLLPLPLPLLVLFAIGRLDWSAYALFSAFASIYGRASRDEVRAGMQLAAGFARTLAATPGVGVALLGS